MARGKRGCWGDDDGCDGQLWVSKRRRVLPSVLHSTAKMNWLDTHSQDVCFCEKTKVVLGLEAKGDQDSGLVLSGAKLVHEKVEKPTVGGCSVTVVNKV